MDEITKKRAVASKYQREREFGKSFQMNERISLTAIAVKYYETKLIDPKQTYKVLGELRDEYGLRKKHYPKWILEGKISEEKAYEQIEIWKQIMEDIQLTLQPILFGS